MSEITDIVDLDVVYLSYDEPQADEFWRKILSQLPWAKRVHGVKGSDAAHKAAAAASDTERFILIDGDNLPDWGFFSQCLRTNHMNGSKVFRWRARNHVNGLCYGNGGLSSWTRRFINNMRTHENTDGSDNTVVEFCYDNDYWAMHDCYSVTYPCYSQYQAWRAGFREGVKLCLDQGRRVKPENFEREIWVGNRNNLVIWCTVGRDVEYGEWAIRGARSGAYKTMFEPHWDYTAVRDFDSLEQIYETLDHSIDYGKLLQQRLNLPITELDASTSAFFKNYQRPYENIDIMLPEYMYKEILHDAARKHW